MCVFVPVCPKVHLLMPVWCQAGALWRPGCSCLPRDQHLSGGVAPRGCLVLGGTCFRSLMSPCMCPVGVGVTPWMVIEEGWAEL